MAKSSKSTTGKRKHEDRNAVLKVAFEPINVEAKVPNTVVLLLSSNEESVLLQALSSLDKYAAKSPQNVEVLCNSNVFEKLIPLLRHPLLYIKRFTIKLLSEMCFCPQVRDMLLMEKCYVNNFMEYLKANEDIVLKEFSSSIVAELTKLSEGYIQLIDSGMIDVLSPNLLCTDPDVQKNCLEIMNNLLRDPYGKDLLIQSSGFQFPPLLDLLLSDYPAVQNLTLDVLTRLTEWSSDNHLQQLFLNSGGVHKLLDTIEDYGMKDIHDKCLNVLSNVCDNPIVLKTLESNGTSRLLRYMDNIHDTDLRLKTLRVVLKLAATSIGRKMLLENEILDQIVPMILEESIGLTSSVCHGLVHLIQDPNALRQVVEKNTVDIIFSVLKQESRDWDARGAAIMALYEILQRDVKSCVDLVTDENQIILVNILMDPSDQLPVNVGTTIANCLAFLAGMEEVREKMIQPELVKALLHCFKERPEDTIPLRIAACEAINALLCSSEIREWLHNDAGLETIWESLTKASTTLPLLQVVANLVYFAIMGDKTLASDLYQLGALNWLYENRTLRNECSAWDVALETFLNNFLPLKFAYIGRLDFTDVIDSNFYITRVPIKPDKVLQGEFPNLKDLNSCGAAPCKLVYVVRFENPKTPSIILENVEEKGSKTSSIVKRKSGKMEKKQSNLTTSTKRKESIDTFKSLKLIPDIYLSQYLERLKEEINKLDIDQNVLLNYPCVSKEPTVVDANVVRAMTKVIAKFVNDQLCGPEPTQSCTNHTLELHLTELKVELETTLLPIGYLRVGLYLERALLFKVLADKVGLPSSLVRGQYGRSWVEVALPDIPPSPRPFYPSKLLRPNFIVDLMHNPGMLIPLKSNEAFQYCKS